jgi:hypothetical protein
MPTYNADLGGTKLALENAMAITHYLEGQLWVLGFWRPLSDTELPPSLSP